MSRGRHRERTGLLGWLWRLFVLLVIWLLGVTAWIVWVGERDQAAKADAIIVLGAAAYDAKPSPVFEERIRHGLDLYEARYAPLLIFTGGYGGTGARFSESQVARRYALKHGVPDDAILIETASRNTVQNLVEAKRLMDQRGLHRVIVVSDPLHMARALRLCRELGILLILDEVQTGIGRCGALLAEELYGVRADIITLGKGLGGGVPLAALLARGKACCAEPGELEGSHHGNALMCAAGLAVLDSVLEPGFLAQVQDNGRHLREGLSRLTGRYGQGEVRGHGLLWALQLKENLARELVAAALHEGLLLNAPQADVVRFSPALTVSKGNIDEMLLRLARAFARLHAQQQARREVPA